MVRDRHIQSGTQQLHKKVFLDGHSENLLMKRRSEILLAWVPSVVGLRADRQRRGGFASDGESRRPRIWSCLVVWSSASSQFAGVHCCHLWPPWPSAPLTLTESRGGTEYSYCCHKLQCPLWPRRAHLWLMLLRLVANLFAVRARSTKKMARATNLWRKDNFIDICASADLLQQISSGVRTS